MRPGQRLEVFPNYTKKDQIRRKVAGRGHPEFQWRESKINMFEGTRNRKEADETKDKDKKRNKALIRKRKKISMKCLKYFCRGMQNI